MAKKKMISIVITAFNEPDSIGKAINAILSQDISEDFELIVACPDPETKNIVLNYKKLDSRVKHFHDPGKGKSFALNLLFKKLKGEILIFTDGDVYLGENSINPIINSFKDSNIGCICGRVISSNKKDNMLGYWSHLLADIGAHRMRKKLSENNRFFECSGYLFAFRNNIVEKIPLDVAEDSIIPFYFFKQGFKLKYVPESKVYVKNPEIFADWLKQRKRTASAHTKLTAYESNFPKVKSFRNEIIEGIFSIWSYPQNLQEFIWTIKLCFARLYMWTTLKKDENLSKKYYNDGWDRVESTK
jgi:cellulose synthase/poly-beta-1,6-N-acetylglucosamine synthase-like glycosyltransferase